MRSAVKNSQVLLLRPANALLPVLGRTGKVELQHAPAREGRVTTTTTREGGENAARTEKVSACGAKSKITLRAAYKGCPQILSLRSKPILRLLLVGISL